MTGTLVIALDRLGRLQTARWRDSGQSGGSSEDRLPMGEVIVTAKGAIPRSTMMNRKDRQYSFRPESRFPKSSITSRNRV